MSGRPWLILFLLTVAIGVTVWMSGNRKPEPPPPEEAPPPSAPVPHVQAPATEDPFTAPPLKKEPSPADIAGSALGTNGLPGPSDPAIIPPTATPSARKDEMAPLPDGMPLPGSALPGSAVPPPPGAYPPPVYDGGPAGPGQGFEGDIPPPPDGGGGGGTDFRDYDPDSGPAPEEGGF